MPVYEFRCSKCNEITSKMLSINSGNKIKCDVCGGIAERIISKSSFVLKGEGWPGKEARLEEKSRKHHEKLEEKDD